jgi:hypothetical protein
MSEELSGILAVRKEGLIECLRVEIEENDVISNWTT